MTATVRPLPVATRPRWPLSHRLLQRGRADAGTVEAGRQLRPHLTGRGMLASDQRTSALDGGLVQIAR